MTAYKFHESDVEIAALDWLQSIGYAYVAGPEIAPGEPLAERATYREVILEGRLRAAVARLNPALPASAIDEVVRKVTRTDSPNLLLNNHQFHRYLVDGVPVTYQVDGQTQYPNARLFDFDPATLHSGNDWLAVNQFSILRQDVAGIGSGATPGTDGAVAGTRRPDIVLFVNGLPLAVFELKNAADAAATVVDAFHQLQNYKREIPDLFLFNEVLVISDGVDARLGTLTANLTWFKPWKTIDGDMLVEEGAQLETLIRGAFAPERFLDLVRHFIVFEIQRQEVTKKMAAYHQFHAANKAVSSTLNAIHEDGRIGTVWHTQGSGKSLTMLFYAGKIIQDPGMQNPTLVVLTDRNDLDDQLFTKTFAPGHELLRQQPVQALDREDLRAKLRVASGGVIFTTIQKFLPEDANSTNPVLSERNNVVFIVDEAHRTQYGFKTRYVKVKTDDGQERLETRYGLAVHMRAALPNAAFIGFTGTPITSVDHNILNVFGGYIDTYDIQRAVQDKATVPIYYEPRYARMKLDPVYVPQIDPDFEEVTEGEEEEQIDRLQAKWSSIRQIVGDSERIQLIAQDMVEHFEARDRALPGKALIVCMSRELCVRMHNEIVRLRPHWYHPDDDRGQIKVIMTGGVTDPEDWGEHVRTKERRRSLADRFRLDPEQDAAHMDFKIAIVRDMWLTGFDAPSLHTLYVDKPMKGLNLMQAIARVNRIFPGKEGGLVVSYLPLQYQLQDALAAYTKGDQDLTGVSQDIAAEVMLEKADVVRALFTGFDYQPFFAQTATQRLTTLANGVNFILGGRDAMRQHYLDAVIELERAYALATPHPDAVAIQAEVAFFSAVKAPLIKQITTGITRTGKTPQDLDRAVQTIVDRAVAPDGILDILDIAGIRRPDISILSDEFLVEVKALPQKNVAVELLRRLINDEVHAHRRSNLIQSRSFAQRLEQALDRYNREQVSAVRLIEDLIDIAHDMQTAQRAGQALGLSEHEKAFYDALADNQSAVEVMGDAQLAVIARELLKAVRQHVTIDWTLRESARARIRILVKRILRNFGYPPDLQAAATLTVVQQAELLAADWAA